MTLQRWIRSISARIIGSKPVIKLVGIASNEAAYIPSWVFHHFRIGVDIVEIYINNTDDNSLKICRKIKKSYANFNYIKADSLLTDCINNGKNFQLAAYNDSLIKSKQGFDNATYLLALDLDEYLTPLDLANNLKNLLHQYPTLDAISFLWYSDDYEYEGPPFQFHYQPTTTLYRLDHVKTLAKITNKLKSCNHHNFIFESEKQPSIGLGGLNNAKLSDNTNTSCNCSKVNASFLNTLDASSTEPWFVLHRIYRSEEEYLASLCRGRKHNNDSRPLKINRWGLSPYPWYKSQPIRLEFKQQDLDKYLTEFHLFTAKHGINKQIKIAQELISNKTSFLAKMIRENTSLATEFKQVFKGTRHRI